MLALQEIEKEILTLPKEDFSKLKKWIYEKDSEEWDIEIEEDSNSGKLDFLIDEVMSEKEQNQLKKI